jgi:hypothetical protein
VRIVYVDGLPYPGGTGQELHIRQFDEEDVLALPTPAGAQAPAWSPDGSRIAFSSGDGVHTMAPDGSEAVLVAPGGRAPVWSPASDRLAYGMDGSVYLMRLDDGAATRLLPFSPGTTWTPTDWSPDGEWIVLTRQRDEGPDVYLLHIHDGTLLRITLDQGSRSAVFLADTEGTAPPIEDSPLLVRGGVGAQNQNIWIFQGGLGISDGVSGAVVTVNEVVIPNVGDGLYPGYYSGELPTAVPAGSTLQLRVTVGERIVEGIGSVPETPILTAPATESVFASGDSVTFRWTSASDPDRFRVYVNTNQPVWHRELPGTTREIKVAATEIPAGSRLWIGVVAYNDGSFSGPAHPDSRMGTMAVREPTTVITIKR